MSSIKTEQVDILTTDTEDSTICIRTITYEASGTLVGERLAQYEALCHECETSKRRDADGRTRISRRRAWELGLTYPVLNALTRAGYIRWSFGGNSMSILILERTEGAEDAGA